MSITTRIFLRYLAMFLVARGWLSEGDGSILASDPDLAMMLEIGLGTAMGAVAEAWLVVERWLKRKPASDFQGENV